MVTPPFGNRNTLSVKFYKKSIDLCDYIAFILPISQFNNNQQMYEFNLIYSEDLGKRDYSDRVVHCCFNIYKKPSGQFNSKPDYRLKDIDIIEVRLNNKKVDKNLLFEYKKLLHKYNIDKYIDVSEA